MNRGKKMRTIEVVKIDTNKNAVSVMDVYGTTVSWDLNFETLPQYINDFIETAKVKCFGNLVTYR